MEGPKIFLFKILKNLLCGVFAFFFFPPLGGGGGSRHARRGGSIEKWVGGGGQYPPIPPLCPCVVGHHNNDGGGVGVSRSASILSLLCLFCFVYKSRYFKKLLSKPFLLSHVGRSTSGRLR